MVYPAKQDWWIACPVVLAGVGLIGAGGLAAYQTAVQALALSQV